MNVYKRYLKYLFKYKLSLFIGIILSLISAVVTLTPILIIQHIVKSAFEQKNLNNLYLSIILGFVALVLIFIFTYLSKFIMEYLSKRIMYKIRGELFNNLLYLPLKFFKDTKPGNIMSTMSNDINELQFFTSNSILYIIKEPIVIILVFVKMFDLNLMLTASIFLLAPVFVLIIHFLSRHVKRIETKIREKLSSLTSIIHQAIYGIEIIKVFAMEKLENKKFKAENKSYLKHDKKIMQYINLNRPMIDLIGGFGVLFLLGFGGYKVVKGEITSSQLTALIVALTTISLPIKNLSETIIRIRKMSASLLRIFKLMDEKSEIIETDLQIQQKIDLKGNIRFDNVSFSYEEENVLSDINIEVKQGQVVAFVGHSGAGKTTLVNLIPRLFEPSQGNIYVDDINIKDIKLNSLRSKISVVTQENIIFDGTVKENIVYGNPQATNEEIIEAAKISHSLGFIEKFEDGFETHVGDRGVKLSGGQCQRITLARAILRKPSILILDEATSSLDSESEKLIQRALDKIIKNQTTLIISHRLSTILHADIIYVIDNGRIVQKGSHHDLLDQGGIYKNLYELQINV